MKKGSFNPNWCTPPGCTIYDSMVEKHLTMTNILERTGIQQDVFLKLLSGDTPLTKQIAKALEIIFGAPAQFWITREAHYREGIEKELKVVKYEPGPPVWADKDGFVKCPYCKGIHRHGGQGNGVASGHRLPDCGTQPGYVVIPWTENQ